MSSSPSVPQPINPFVTASAQADINKQAGQQQQELNMVNQTSPTAQLSYTQIGTNPDGTPIYSATAQYTPAEQALLQQQEQLKGTFGAQAKNLVTGANYGATLPGDAIGNATSGLVSNAMKQQVAYLQPYFDYQKTTTDAALRNQGFAPGQPGYDNAMQNLTKAQGGTVANFLSTIEPQMYQQATSSYLLPLTMATSMFGNAGPNAMGFQQTPTTSVQPANLTGAVSAYDQAQMAAYNAQKAQNDAIMSGLFGMGSATLGGLAQAGTFAPMFAAI